MEHEADDDPMNPDDPSLEKPREGMKPLKKPKITENSDLQTGPGANQEQHDKDAINASKIAKLEKRKQKRKLKAEKAAHKQEKADAKKAHKQQEQPVEVSKTNQDEADVDNDTRNPADINGTDVEALNLEGITEKNEHDSGSSVTPTPVPESPPSPGPHSASSSTSSIIPPSTTDPSERLQSDQISTTKASDSAAVTTATESQPDKSSAPPNDQSTIDISKPKKLPSGSEINTELLRARLKTRIEALRAARNADSPDGTPARNRQELLEQRRRKEEERRQRKKEMRKKQQEAEEAKKTAAQQDARLERAGKLGGTIGQSKARGTKEPKHNFSYGNIQFGDGQGLDSTLSIFLPAPKKKGPQDAKTALAAAQHKHARVAGLDADQRGDIETKDRWLNARKRVHGEKVRDDEGLLRKTVRRKEKAKGKSAKEWTEREEGVRQGQAARQRKREENLKKRREGKGGGSKKNKGVMTKKGGKKKRPGFEGRFRT